MAELSVRNVCVQFAGLRALDDVSFSVADGEIVGLMGPNGAGKSTALNAISRLIDVQSGSIVFDARDLGALPAHALADLGIARVFQHPQLCSDLTARENVALGLHHRVRRHPAWALARAGPVDAALERDVDDAIAFCDFAEFAQRRAGDLPYGVQKRVELARAIAASPRLLVLDEPAAGLGAHERVTLVNVVRALHARSRMSMLIVEHDIELLSSLVDRLVVLDFGRVIQSGTPAEVMAHEDVIRAYVGGSTDA